MPTTATAFFRPPPLAAGPKARPLNLTPKTLIPKPPSNLRFSAAAATATSFLRRSPPPPAAAASGSGDREVVYFDGGAHYGDLVANLLLGLTLFWLPLTVAAVFRAFFLRYRFTNRRVTVVSGLTGGDRRDFPYASVSSVVAVPRFIGEWGDVVITLKDGTKVDLRSVPKFREVAEYCRTMTAAEGRFGGVNAAAASGGRRPRGF